jgi:lipopolysaccharide transport system permease protein
VAAIEDEHTAAVTPHPVSVTHIAPSRGWRGLEAHDLWWHRELLYFLTWRDVKVRYKQSVLGAAWAVLQPFLTMLIFSVFFGHFAQIPSDGVPYPVFSFAGLVPWTFFANSMTTGANSVILTPELVTKVYFPRVMMPTAAILAGAFDLAIAFVVLVAMMIFYGIVPGPEALFVLPLLLLLFVTTLGVALWLSALSVAYRDVQSALPFLLQMWLFATPIAYPSSLVPLPWRTLMGLNPMAGVVEGLRWALLGTQPAPGPLVWVSAAAALVVFVTGLLYFQRVEGRFADVI